MMIMPILILLFFEAITSSLMLILFFLILSVFLSLKMLKTWVLMMILVLYVGGVFLMMLYMATLSKEGKMNLGAKEFLLLMLFISNENKKIYLETNDPSYMSKNLWFFFIIMLILISLMTFISFFFSQMKEPIRIF